MYNVVKNAFKKSTKPNHTFQMRFLFSYNKSNEILMNVVSYSFPIIMT